MKLKIQIKRHDDIPLPIIINKGDWVDLCSAEDVYIKHKGGYTLFSLGISMKLPEGFEAILAPRSSTPGKFGSMVPNSIGVIDNTYSGNDDIWKMTAYCIKQGGTYIRKGDRIAQFRIQLSQKATFWQKLKWFLSNGIEIVEVDNLDDVNRGGFGSTDSNVATKIE